MIDERIDRLSAERDRFRCALREVIRLRLATGEGTCAKRFDKAWEVAAAALNHHSAEK